MFSKNVESLDLLYCKSKFQFHFPQEIERKACFGRLGSEDRDGRFVAFLLHAHPLLYFISDFVFFLRASDKLVKSGGHLIKYLVGGSFQRPHFHLGLC